MIDKLDEKQKNRIPNPDTGKGWIALILAFVFSLFMCFGVGGVYLREPEGTSLFYPLLMMTQYSAFQVVLWGITLVLFVSLLIFSAKYNPILALLSFVVFFVGGFFLFVGICFGAGQAHTTPYQTLPYQNHLYRLVAVWDADVWEFPRPTEAYHVLKCDSTGLVCVRHKTPYSVRLRDEMGNSHMFDTSGKLFIDADQTLKLRVGDAVYPILNESGA